MSAFAISFSDEASGNAMDRLDEMRSYAICLTFASGVRQDATLVGSTRIDGMCGVEFAQVYAAVGSDDGEAWRDADQRATAGKTQKARLYDDVVDIHIY